MATKDTEKVLSPWEDLVEFRAPRERGTKNADIFVGVNGHNYQIKRGETVKIPRCVAEVLYNSQMQDEHTAELIDQLTK